MSILKLTQEMYPCFYDNMGKRRTAIIGIYGKMGLAEKQIETIFWYFKLLLETDFVSEPFKIYITHYGFSMKNVQEELIRNNRNASSVIGKITTNRRKIQRHLGKDIIECLCSFSEDVFLHARKKIMTLISKYFDNRIEYQNYLSLPIPICTEVPNLYVEEKDFIKFIEIISPYFKPQMEYVAKNLDKNICSYFNFLMDGIDLSEKDAQRRNQLLKMWGGLK